jgi:hypothetical protein
VDEVVEGYQVRIDADLQSGEASLLEQLRRKGRSSLGS